MTGGEHMRMTWFCLLLAASAVAVAEDREDVVKSGSIYAVVDAAADGSLSFAEPPSGGLPESILAQLEPTFLSRVREAHADVEEEATYHVAIDWKLVRTGDKEQLQFDYKTSDPKPLVLVEPAFPTLLIAPEEDMEVILRFTVNPDGSVENVARGGGNPRREFFENARDAVRQWSFVPKYKNGIAVPWDVQLPILFLKPGTRSEDIYVRFRLDGEGEPHKLEFDRPIPDCHDVDRLREELKVIIRESDAATAVRRGVTRERNGQMSYTLPPCPEVA